jgi:hypothetical protein
MVEFAPMVLATPEGWVALFMVSVQPQDRTKTAPRLVMRDGLIARTGGLMTKRFNDDD